MGQRNGIIDVFRVLTAFAVVAYHFLMFQSPEESLFPQLSADQPFFQWLQTPVLLFFILTAIVIPIHLHENRYTLSDSPIFMAKRLIRIHYPFIILLLATVFIQLFFLWRNNQPLSFDWRQFTGNITLSAEFMHVPWYNTIFWTLAIEMQFYLVIAIIFPLFRKFDWKALLVFLSVGEWLHFIIPDSRFLWYYTPFIAVGILFYLYIYEKISRLIFLGCLLLFTASTIAFHQLDTVWVIVVFAGAFFLFQKTSPFWSKLSLYTYSFYLVHGLAGGHFIYFTHSWGNELPMAITRVILAIIVAGIASWIFYHFVEKQSMKWMRTIRYRKN